MAENIAKRFGVIAIEKGFITKDQFIDAMAMQIEINLSGNDTKKKIGEILKDIGYITDEQIKKVLEELSIPVASA